MPIKLVMLPGLDGTGILFKRFIKEYGGHTEVIALPESGHQDHQTLAEAIAKRLPLDYFYKLLFLGSSASNGLISEFVQVVNTIPAHLDFQHRFCS